jgi:hypothetical protein
MDPSNDEPVISLPADLFVPPNVPIIEVVAPCHGQRMTLDTLDEFIFMVEDANSWTGDFMLQALTIDDPVLTLDLETSIMATQFENHLILEQWAAAHNLEHRPGDLW